MSHRHFAHVIKALVHFPTYRAVAVDNRQYDNGSPALSHSPSILYSSRFLEFVLLSVPCRSVLIPSQVWRSNMHKLHWCLSQLPSLKASLWSSSYPNTAAQYYQQSQYWTHQHPPYPLAAAFPWKVTAFYPSSIILHSFLSMQHMSVSLWHMGIKPAQLEQQILVSSIQGSHGQFMLFWVASQCHNTAHGFHCVWIGQSWSGCLRCLRCMRPWGCYGSWSVSYQHDCNVLHHYVDLVFFSSFILHPGSTIVMFYDPFSILGGLWLCQHKAGELLVCILLIPYATHVHKPVSHCLP